MENLITIDVETGGFDANKNIICSVCMKKFNSNETFEVYIKPNKKLTYVDTAFKVNRLSIEFLEENGVYEKEAIEKILSFISDKKYFVLGYNVRFDINFLNALFLRNGHDRFLNYIDYHTRDCMVTALFLNDCGIIDLDKFSLIKVYESIFKEHFNNAHSSRGDVLATERLYKYFIELMKKLKKNYSYNGPVHS